MHSTYVLYNIVPLAFLILLIVIFIDVFLDYFRKVRRVNLRRVILYSFIFYIICLIQIKFGGFTLPQNPADISSRFITTNDWFGVFDTITNKIYFWRYSAIFYNFVVIVPFGMYLSYFLNMKSYGKVISIVILSCIGIEFFRLLFGWLGMTMTVSNVDNIYLLFNILGGVVGVIIIKYEEKVMRKSKSTSGVNI